MAETDEKKALVRGGDGSLYLVSETGPPTKLTEEENERVEDILENTGEELGKAIDREIPRICLGGTHHVHIALPEVFME